MSTRILNLTTKLYKYLLSVSLRESPALKHLRQATQQIPGGVMQIAPEQGQFMALLIELIAARNTLDIGTFTGYSAAVVAEALPAGGKVISFDIDKTNTAIAKRYWQQAGVAHKIDLCLGQAVESLDTLLKQGQQGYFDFAFIDADKRNYDNYYERCLQLLRPGGLIVIDNTLWDGEVVNDNNQKKSTSAIRALNKKLHHDERVTISLLPVADGLTLLRKR